MAAQRVVLTVQGLTKQSARLSPALAADIRWRWPGGLPVGAATAKERGRGNCFVPPSNEAMKDSDAA